MRRFETNYRLGENDTASPETFNSRFKDLDDRLNDHDELRGEILQLRDTVLYQAAQRIDDFILPALDSVREIQSSGFLIAGIAESSAVSFVEGEVSIAVDQDMKSIFRPTAFVALVRHDTADDWAVARVMEYHEDTGVLDLDILAVSGAAGPHEDVIVSATGGGAAGQIAFLNATKAAMEQAVTKRNEAVAAKEASDANALATAADRIATGEDRLATGADRLAAEGAAEAAALSAGSVDLTAFAKKDGSTAFTGVQSGVDPDGEADGQQLTTAAWVIAYIASVVTALKASASAIWAGTSDALFTTPKNIADSHAFQTLTDASTINWNMASGYNAKVTLGGSRTLGAPTNAIEGRTYVLRVIQDNNGTRTLAFNAAFDFGEAGAPTITTGANKHCMIVATCIDASTPKFATSFWPGA